MDERPSLPLEATDEAATRTREMHEHYQAGELDAAFKAGRQALVLWHALKEHEQCCEVLYQMAWACLEHEQGIEALALARHSLRLARVRQLPLARVQSLALLAVLHARLHDAAVAENLAMQALSRARDLRSRPAMTMALDALLRVLLDALEAQRAAQDLASAHATASRLVRHTQLALAHSGAAPNNFADLGLRINAAAALGSCARDFDALPILATCIELARDDGFHLLGKWARCFSAQSSLTTGNQAAAAAVVKTVGALVSPEDPPRLRLALLLLQAKLVHHKGDVESAAELRLTAGNVHASLMRQRYKLRKTLRRNADDVLGSINPSGHGDGAQDLWPGLADDLAGLPTDRPAT